MAGAALHVRSSKPDADGVVMRVTPESAGWRYVGFEVLRLDGRVERREQGREACVVLIAGHCSFMGLGDAERATPFDGTPVALYAPPGEPWWVEGAGEIAICTAPAEGRFEPRLLASPELITRGDGAEERRIANILMESEEAESLLVTEVVTPAGHWSSFPPHKHDRDDPPHEALLEETYYHRLRDGVGFAFQRIYTDDRSLDVGVAAEDGDVVLVPRGYHPVAGAARSDLYYLNVMAGPVRAWRVSVDPAYH
jgi:5-deoxy-glucuronate isomerase